MKLEQSFDKLYGDICKLVEDARLYLAKTSNKTLTVLYWQIGDRINNELLDGERASYGKQIVSDLATKLQKQYGKRGFQDRNIHRMMQFSKLYPDYNIVSELATELS